MQEVFLSSPNAIMYTLLQFLIYFPSGFLLLNGKIKSVPSMVRIPIYLSLGLIVTTVLLSIIGIFYIGSSVLIILTIILYGLTFLRMVKSKTKLNFEYIKKTVLLNLTRKLEYESYFAVMFIFVIIHFSLVAAYMGWPPPGDVALAHGFLTSLLVHNQKLQYTLAPIAPSEFWPEPFGLHVIAANLSILLGIFPGQAVFVLATAIIILLVSLTYSLVYIFSRSIAFSIVALFAAFYVHPSLDLEYWIVGYYYNGPYANLFGYLALLVFVGYNFSVASNKDHLKKDIRFALGMIVVLAGIVIVYTPFIIIPGIYLVIYYLFRHFSGLNSSLTIQRNSSQISNGTKSNSTRLENTGSQRQSSLLGNRSIQGTVAVAGIFILFLFLLIAVVPHLGIFSQINRLISEITGRIHGVSTDYSIDSHQFLSDYSGIFILLTMVAAIASILKRRYVGLSLFYLLFSGTLVLSIPSITKDYTWFILSRRTLVFVAILTWIVFLTYASNYLRTNLVSKLSKVGVNKKYLNNPNIVGFSKGILSIFLISILFLPSFISNITFQQADIWSWFTRSDYFRNDSGLLSWISDKTNSSDLLMTDFSYTSLFIKSFSPKNTTDPIYPNSPLEFERARDSLIAWNRPSLLDQFVHKYGVKYVVLLSDPYYYDRPRVYGDGHFHIKSFTVDEYRAMLNQMRFLKVVKEAGPAAVYAVVK